MKTISFVSAGENLVSEQTLQVQEADEAGWRHDGHQRFSHGPWTVERLPHGCARVDLAHHREGSRGHHGLLHPQLHLVVPKRAPRVYATVAAHVRRERERVRAECRDGDPAQHG